METLASTVLTTASIVVFYLLLLTCLVLLLILGFRSLRSNKKPGAPGPKPWPLIGSLHLMDGYKIPFAAFTELSQKYGNIFSIKLGNSWCVVVNDPKDVKEVLITKGAHFDGRPTLRRFDVLFGGDKENSLAFCNNSMAQKKRRQILQKFTFPHLNSDLGITLDRLCQEECNQLIAIIQEKASFCETIDLKPLIIKGCANIFSQYFCSTERFDYENYNFAQYCNSFDEIFWEVNNGRAVDFLPWLMPFYENSTACFAMKKATCVVRSFVKEFIINAKRLSQGPHANSSTPKDFLDTIMVYLNDEKSLKQEAILTSQTALFALEDILGGHSAVANIILRILYDISLQKEYAAKITGQIEIVQSDKIGLISLEEKHRLPVIVAAMHETIRLTCSPIVPHQATQDSSIGGHLVPKDTVIFVNNHALNMSDKFWNSPSKYDPIRFIDTSTGDFVKPSHFQPFSMGKRSCMGYKMVHNIAFSLVANILLHFDLESPSNSEKSIPLGMLALPSKPFEFTIRPKQKKKLSRNNFQRRNFA
uniref:Cytochrome P450 307F1 n=1 Tax=Paracyclopina nana TaxID=565004 RepID=A0A0F7J1T6_PARNA|nr:cytochrome P450 307F1 [Paracyclopina nana]